MRLFECGSLAGYAPFWRGSALDALFAGRLVLSHTHVTCHESKYLCCAVHRVLRSSAAHRGGDLLAKLQSEGPMPEPQARRTFQQILVGVAHCNGAGVAHRDIKLENVMLDDVGDVKIIDFGLAHHYPWDARAECIDRSQPLRIAKGSKPYVAPELCVESRYVRSDAFVADAWSLGICLFAMMCGFFPMTRAAPSNLAFKHACKAQQAGRSTTEAMRNYYSRPWSHLSAEVKALIDGLLTIEQIEGIETYRTRNKRLTLDEALVHPWLHGGSLGGNDDDDVVDDVVGGAMPWQPPAGDTSAAESLDNEPPCLCRVDGMKKLDVD